MKEVIIVGTGFGGISAAINLIKLNITNFIMLERRAFAGGTWVQNRYPGAAVDVQSPLYSLNNEPFPWSRMFAHQNELEAYTNHLLDKHHLRSKIRLNSTVTKAMWDDGKWRVILSDGSELLTKSLINATGPLSSPVIPTFKGLQQYQGAQFHCNHWPDNLDLKDKRVAIIGSGASAVQIIPAIVDKVDHLHVFQRTPHWVLPRPDFKFPLWCRRLLEMRLAYSLVKFIIYWLLELRVIAFKYSKLLLKLVGELPAKRLMRKQITDLQLRAALTPDFTIGCKRILVSNTYYPALQKANVTLHDKHDSIVEFTKNGIKTIKHEFDVDIVIFATGYNPQESMVSYHVVGRHAVSLATQWQAYPRAYLGTSMPYFPNFFVVTGPNTGIGHTSAVYVIESQISYIMQCLQILRRGASSIEPTEYAEDQYTHMVHNEMRKTVWQTGGCSSWYQNASGKVIAMFPGFSFVFRRLCQKFKPKHHNIQ